MAAPPLDSDESARYIRAKLRRAWGHLDLLDQQINAFNDTNPYRAAASHEERDGLEWVYTLRLWGPDIWPWSLTWENADRC